MSNQTTTETQVAELATYMEENGFTGNIPINKGAKNWYAIKRLMKFDSFYTFGIERINAEVATKKINAAKVRDILVEASGLTVKRFQLDGPGYFDPTKSAMALLSAKQRLEQAARDKSRIAFGTGHPGAMVGFLSVLAEWAEGLGAEIVRIDSAIQIDDRQYVDMIGSVFVASDNCQAFHTHDTSLMDTLMANREFDLAVGDHGFIGAATNRDIPSIAFYDTDDPAAPLAEHLGLPVLAVPLNDNRYNANSAALARFILK